MPTEKPLKILVIQFRYLGDTVVLIPALRAIRERYPDCELHILVPGEVGPLLQHLPWLTRLWLMPRRRGRALFSKSWPVLRALRAERFDWSVDFGGVDRSAIMTFLVGARQRLGFLGPGGFLGRRFCYTHLVPLPPRDRHESRRLMHLLTALGIDESGSLETEIHTDPALDLPVQPAAQGMAADALGDVAAIGRDRRNRVTLQHRRGRAGGSAHGRFQTARPGGVRFATGSRPRAISRRAQTRPGVRHRRHRPAAFCRRGRHADPGIVRSHVGGSLGAGGFAPPVSHRQRLLLLQRQRLQKCGSLHGRHHARAGVRGNQETGSSTLPMPPKLIILTFNFRPNKLL